MALAISRVKGDGSSAVKPSQQGGLFDVWLFLNGEPDDEWVRAFTTEAEAADVNVRYELHERKPALVLSSEEEAAIHDVIFKVDRLIDRANDRRRQKAAAEREREDEQRVRDQRAEKIQNEIDQRGGSAD
jgi:hypothetical protein